MLVGDKEKVNLILNVVNDVRRYDFFRMSQDLGIVYGKNDIPFTDMILFSWIKGSKRNG